ncbi:MAG: hypothetical protein HY305_02490 [Sphingobacteriales bacterium]|nr:hypothetical protein [Sphingobacteriales bacterium]
MKKLLLSVLLTVSYLQFTNAQVNVNIAIQPAWAPVGYDYVDYYYIPDIDAYYNVPAQQYIYLDNGGWIYSTGLPPRYRDFDIYHSYKVVINEDKPYLRNDVYRSKYVGYKGRHDQLIIRESNDSRYFINRNHPQHKIWKQEHRNNGNGNNGHHGNGGGNGRGRGHHK